MKSCNNVQSDIFALIYNFLLRSTIIKSESLPSFINKLNSSKRLDYQHIYEMAIIILLLIKNNIFNNTVKISSCFSEEHTTSAISLINYYGTLFGKITGKGYRPIKYVHSVNLRVGINSSKANISITYSNDKVFSREIWYGRRIKYHLDEKMRTACEQILCEISPYHNFSEGQFESICSILNSNASENSVCIMPTGSGKSLVFYMVSFLQPLPVLVIAPTDILIADQIRNLRETHNIDDVLHLKNTSDFDFKKFDICTKFTYMTPSTFQNRDFLSKCIFFNNGTQLNGLREEKIVPDSKLAYIILDEIHCMSNWGHDFRPEYLMLAEHLKKYFTKVPIIGFTGTADYTVALDIQKQLNIPQKNIFSPVTFDKFNTDYKFIRCDTQKEMQKSICNLIEKQIVSNERTIVFVKNAEQVKYLNNIFHSKIAVFIDDSTDGYKIFTENNSPILVTNSDLGVGVNFRNVRCTVHFGLPMSKNDFVQQSGRAGRNNEDATSYVFYLSKKDNAPKELFQRDLVIDTVPKIKFHNDYTDVISEIYHFKSQIELSHSISDYYHTLKKKNRALLTEKISFDEIQGKKQLLYMLYRIGYVNDWYTSDNLNTLMIDIRSSNNFYFSDEKNMLARVKERSLNFFEFIDEENDYSYDIDNADSIEKIIDIFSEWYFTKYSYKHKEAFIDLFDFIDNNLDSDNSAIVDEIRNYYLLPFMKIKSDEEKYNNLSPSDIIRRFMHGITYETISNLERSLNENYNVNIDFATFVGRLKYSHFDSNRIERILTYNKNKYLTYVYQAILRMYSKTNLNCRFNILKWASKNIAVLNDNFEGFLQKIYDSNPRDEIYYGLIAQHLNKKF